MTAALVAPSVSLIKERTALYRFFRKDGALLYVGITSTLGIRWNAHMTQSEWWPEAVRVAAEWQSARSLALRAELIAIQTEGPLFNRAGRPPRKRPPRRPPSSATPKVSLVKRGKRQWLSTADTAKLLRVSESTVYRACRSGKTADEWFGADGWREKPLLRRPTFQIDLPAAERRRRRLTPP